MNQKLYSKICSRIDTNKYKDELAHNDIVDLLDEYEKIRRDNQVFRRSFLKMISSVKSTSMFHPRAFKKTIRPECYGEFRDCSINTGEWYSTEEGLVCTECDSFMPKKRPQSLNEWDKEKE